jgi:Fe-S cluster assembly protein SufD
MITQLTTPLYHQLVAAFQDRVAVRDTGALTEIRMRSFDRFKQTGFPSVKAEDWKYTNLQSVISGSYLLEDTLPGTPVSSAAASVDNLDAYRIVLVNGRYRADLSDQPDAEERVTILPIEQATDELLFVKHFAAYADKTDNPFVALNTAMFKHGLYIAVEKNGILKKALHIVHIASGTDPLFSQTRNLYLVGANAQAEIVESFITDEGAGDNLNNLVTEVVLEEGARLQHYYLQQATVQSRYVNHAEIYQRKHSLYNNYNCTFPGAAFVRNNIHVRMDDPAVESHLYGIVLTAGSQLVDNHTVVDHLKPHCESYEWYKNITQDTSTAVFNGKIFVRTDAQKTNAFQQNNNMLIGEKSAVYTKPQLEKFADDVKCSHGCTIGQFNEEALFYLRSRGIGEEQARVLLVHAFAFDVTSRFSNEAVRTHVERLVEEGL